MNSSKCDLKYNKYNIKYKNVNFKEFKESSIKISGKNSLDAMNRLMNPIYKQNLLSHQKLVNRSYKKQYKTRMDSSQIIFKQIIRK